MQEKGVMVDCWICWCVTQLVFASIICLTNSQSVPVFILTVKCGLDLVKKSHSTLSSQFQDLFRQKNETSSISDVEGRVSGVCVPNCSKLHCTVCIQILVRLNKVVSFKLLVEKMKKTSRDVIYKYNRQSDLLYYHYHLEPCNV